MQTHDSDTIDHASICRCCGALCGVIVSVRGNTVVSVRGDQDDPVSRGYLCPKGRALPAFHHSARRLDQPSVNGAVTPWDEVLDDLTTRITSLRKDFGPDSVGVYTATGQYTDTAALYTESRFFKGLGSRQRYTAATVDCAPTWRAAELVTGFAMPFHPTWLPEDATPSLVIMIGFNPVVSHVYFGARLPDPIRRIRDYRSRGGEVWVIDPRRTETAALADRHLPIRPNTDAFVLAWLVREILVEGADQVELRQACSPREIQQLADAVRPFTVEVVAERAGVDERDLSDLLATIRRHQKLAAISATGVNFSRDGVVAEWLRWALLIITGSLDRRGGMRFSTGDTVAFENQVWTNHAPAEGGREPGPPSRPDLHGWRGEYPCAALIDEINAGHLRGLFVGGGSPLTAFPDPDRTREALETLSFLAVMDVADNQLCELATHVLPVAGALERADLLRSYIPAVVEPVAERRPGWWIYAQLGQRLGIDTLDGIDLDDRAGDGILRRIASGCRDGADALLDAGPHGLPAPAQYGWVHDRVLPGGKWRLGAQVVLDQIPKLLERTIPPLTLVSQRVMHRHNVVAYEPRGAMAPFINLNPADADLSQIADGDRLRVTSPAGSVEGAAKRDRRLRQGTVSINHGWLALNVARLIDGRDDIDPLSGQPVQTGVAVRIERVSPAGRPIEQLDNETYGGITSHD